MRRSDLPDVLIIGAGIVGCACALECVRAGLRVSLLEASVPGGAATGAAMGHIVAMDDSPPQLALSSYSRALWKALQPALPPATEQAIEYDQRGTLWIAADDDELREAVAKQQTYAAAGVRSESLSPAALAEAEPNLRPGLAGALLVPDDAILYPPAAAIYFLQTALREGATLLRGKAAFSIEPGAVTLDDGTRLAAGQIVLACGADRRLLPHLPIKKRKGHLVITDRYPGFVRHQLVELGYLRSAHQLDADSVAFNLQPRRTGQLLIGSSRQFGNEDPAVDRRILTAMLDRARSYVPALATLSALRVWTGFRAATPDKLPLIGPTADPKVFLAMGFEGLGITNAPGAARLLVDHLVGRTSAIDPAPYLPERLSVEAREQEPGERGRKLDQKRGQGCVEESVDVRVEQSAEEPVERRVAERAEGRVAECDREHDWERAEERAEERFEERFEERKHGRGPSMPDNQAPPSPGVTVWVNGSPLTLPRGAMVSAALLSAGAACRTSVSGQPRTAQCGIGICFECRAIIDGVPHRRTCQLPCREGLQVRTQP